jgi:DNA-binding NarL/FixJ family response regulator
MTTLDARETLPFLGIEGETRHSPQLGKGVSIALIDRRPFTRQCLSRWLQEGSPDLRVVSVGSPADLLDASRSRSAPHSIIFSIGAGTVRDPEVLGKITLLRRHLSRIPLVLLSDSEDVDDIIEAIEQGVRGYIPTSLEPCEAAAALQCVMAGGTFVPVSAMIKLVKDRPRSRQADELETNPIQQLTPRESEVLACLRQGKPNKIIGHELQISENTVKVFVRRILTKLHASNRTEVAVLSRKRAEPGGAG